MTTQEPPMQISRVTRSRSEARSSYNRISRWYDALAGSSEKRFMDAGLRLLHVQEGERVLEIGFGTGHGIVALARTVGQAGRVYGLDLSAGMLRMAQDRVSRAGLAERVDLRLGDAVELPFEAGSLDAVFLSFTLELFDTPEIPVVLGQCRRVLCSGGRLGVVAVSRSGQAGAMLRLYEWAHERLPRYVDCRPIYAQEAVRAAGFQIVDTTVKPMWGLPVEIVLARA